jgi:hypothetical protein
MVKFVKPPFEIDTPHLHDPEPPSLRSVVNRQLFQENYAMGYRV